MSTDPRSTDVDSVARLLADADRKGDVELPSLLAIDLITTGGRSQAMVDAAMWTTWSELTDETRAMATLSSITSLAARKLLEIPDSAAPASVSSEPSGGFDMPVSPPLALILAARARPTVLAVRYVEGQREPISERVYGFGDSENPVRACVVERATRRRASLGEDYAWAPNQPTPAEPGDLNRVYAYRLQSPNHTARELAAWAMEPAQTPPGGGWPPPRTVELIRHDPDRPVTRDRLAVEGDGIEGMVSWTRADGVGMPPTQQHRPSLAATIADLMVA